MSFLNESKEFGLYLGFSLLEDHISFDYSHFLLIFLLVNHFAKINNSDIIVRFFFDDLLFLLGEFFLHSNFFLLCGDIVVNFYFLHFFEVCSDSFWNCGFGDSNG